MPANPKSDQRESDGAIRVKAGKSKSPCSWSYDRDPDRWLEVASDSGRENQCGRRRAMAFRRNEQILEPTTQEAFTTQAA